MAIGVRAGVFLLAVVSAAQTVDLEVQELFNKARARVLDNSKRLPRYTCVETVDRTQYSPAVEGNGTCQSAMAMHRLSPQHGSVLVRDRLRLDVAVVDQSEIFSWAGARKFETHDMGELINGATGSGEFGSFLLSVFGDEPDRMRYLGRRNDSLSFDFNVPLAKSTYQYRTIGPNHTVPFHGSFLIDPTDAELQELTIDADQFPPGDGVCLIEHKMDYQRVTIGSSEFMLPQVSTMDGIYRNGDETLNETHYSDCREYVGESTIRFDDDETQGGAAAGAVASKPLPPKQRLQIGLVKPIDTTIAAAGDAIDGLLLKDVGDKKTGILARSGEHVHGRILRLQQYMTPTPRWFLVVRFDRIERGGVEQTLALKQMDGGDRLALTGRRQQPVPKEMLEKPVDAGLFIFEEHGNVTIDPAKFRSEWETK